MAIERIYWHRGNSTRAVGCGITSVGAASPTPATDVYQAIAMCFLQRIQRMSKTGTPELGKIIVLKMTWIGPEKPHTLSYS